MLWLHVLRRWASADRIRRSPAEGKLLRLRVGACLRVRGLAARVTERVVRDEPTDQNVDGGSSGLAAVEYVCVTVTGGFRLRLRPTADGQTRAWMTPPADEAAHEEEAVVEDIEVFG